MKIFIVVLGFLVFPLTSQGRARPYLQTLVQGHGLTKLATSPIWRRYFPASKDITTSLNDFINTQLSPGELSGLESDAVAQRMEGLRAQWFEEFYPEPTEARVLEVLGEDAELRAMMVAFLFAYNMVQQQDLRIPAQQIFLHSLGGVMLIRAIDREDMDGKELKDKLNKFIENNTMEFVYVGDGYTPYVPGREEIFYTGREDYLLRNNHVKHPPLHGETLKTLWARGYTAAPLIAAMPPQVANMLLEQMVLLDEDGLISGYHPVFLFDLLSELGIIGNFAPSVYQAEAFDLEEVVASELGTAVSSDAFEEAIAMLTAKDNPASLVQITQMSRMGYSLEEISALSYPAREAIIVSGHHSREAFANQHGTDIAELHEILEKTGELVFFLLHHGMAKSSEDIQPHHALSHAVMQQANQENEVWSMLMGGGKFVISSQEQPQQD